MRAHDVGKIAVPKEIVNKPGKLDEREWAIIRTHTNAMTTDRSYRKAMSIPAALGELAACAGTQFDPRIVEALIRVVGQPGGALIGARS